MIKFIDNNGNIYEGQSPYIHWVKNEQSTGLWYNIKLIVISDQPGPLSYSGLSEDSIFDFVKLNSLSNNVDLSTIIAENKEYTDYSSNTITIDDIIYYVYQIIIICKSDIPGQYTDSFQLKCGNYTTTVEVGADFYDANEVLSINLSNRGLDLPIHVEKAFYENNFNEANINNILLNQKFKELISNYIDVIDCKGSYKSLLNSLKWFDWGDNIKLYEIWKNQDDIYFEKNFELILSQIYKDLLYTQSKTTYISLVTALQKTTDKLDEEKNPIIENITRKWSNEELAIKISILGAFFERFFMPIYMDLKRASVEALVNSIPVKTKSGELIEINNYFYDTDIIDIDMPHIVTLGNLDGSDELHPYKVAVGKNTVFGRNWNDIKDGKYYMIPVGVSVLDDIKSSGLEEDYENHNQEIVNSYSQLVGDIGVIIPVNVTVYFSPDVKDDAINVETINLYKDGIDKKPIQVVERNLYNNLTPIYDEDEKIIKYKTSFKFNLLSQKEEEVSFTLVLHSLSGHTWTACAGYKAIDISGCDLSICKVNGIDYTGNPKLFKDIIKDNLEYNTFITQYNDIIVDDYEGDNIIPDYYHGKHLIQYLPYNRNNDIYHDMFVIENEYNDESSEYDMSWESNINLNNYWIFHKKESESEQTYKYTYLINKKGGIIDNKIYAGFNNLNIKIHRMIFIPQLQNYIDIDKGIKKSDFEVTRGDLLCVIPKFKRTLKNETIKTSWEFINKTTLEHIMINDNIPLSTPIIANNQYKLLSKGYWTVIMKFKLGDDKTEHKIIKNSAFIIT